MSADLKNLQNKALDARAVLSLAIQRAHEITTYENGEIEVEQVARKADDLEAALRLVHRLVGEIACDMDHSSCEDVGRQAGRKFHVFV